MIQRRQFFGSLAALATLPTFTPSLFAASREETLPWKCDVIQTIPHGKGNRTPVVTGVSLQKGGDLVAIVGDDHHIGIYDSAQSKFIHDLAAHTDWIRTAKFSPNGRILATAGNDRKLKIWNVETFGDPQQFQHQDAIIDIAFTSDSKRLATVGFNRELAIYDLNRHRFEKRLRCECPDNHAVAFSQDDTLIAAGGRSGVIRVWQTDSGRQLNQIKLHRQRIRSIEFTQDKQLISCGDDQVVKITDLKTENSRTLPRHSAKLFSMVILNKTLMATAGSDNKIHIWRIADGQEMGTLKGHTGTVSCLDFSANKLASGSFDTHVRLWTMDEQDPLGRQTRLFRDQR